MFFFLTSAVSGVATGKGLRVRSPFKLVLTLQTLHFSKYFSMMNHCFKVTILPKYAQKYWLA